MNNLVPLNKDFELGFYRTKEFEYLDSYYVLWPGENFQHTAFLINFNFERLLQKDPKFRGFLSDITLCSPPGRLNCYPSISSLDFLQRRKKGERVGLLSFASTPLEFVIHKNLLSFAFSFLTALASKGAPHTYATLEDERSFIFSNLERYSEIISGLADAQSKKMLSARLYSLARLNHDSLVYNYFPTELEYFNNISENYSFFLKEKEVYVDVGASWGDCVQRFAGMVNDLEHSHIYAFEPNASEFNRLKQLRFSLPLTASSSIVSNENGVSNFLSDEKNPHGSRVISSQQKDGQKTKTVKLDTECPNATLIKIDAEGAEPKIIEGALNVLQNPDCRLVSSVYHYLADLFETIDLMKSIGRTKFFYRQHHPSLWDSIIYFE
jgi:FkbM family methyltransferase